LVSNALHELREMEIEMGKLLDEPRLLALLRSGRRGGICTSIVFLYACACVCVVNAL
jgi:hypothetical protein